MSIVFAALTPHPPVLVPEIGKEHIKKIDQTVEAMKKLEQEFYAAKPETVVIISPHGKILPDAFSINLSAAYTCHFKDFGDFGLTYEYKSDYMSIQEIRAADEGRKSVPLVLTSEEEIDHGFSVPLSYILAHAKTTPIIPITYSGLGYAEHVAFGEFLHQQLSRIDKRFAVIASGDLSHRLTKESPAGFSPRGAEFDAQLLKLVQEKNLEGILGLDKGLIADATECGLRSLLIALGALSDMPYTPQQFSYEGPFGVGYSVINFQLN
jgi:AmmeMemoRadiSam system protein B